MSRPSSPGPAGTDPAALAEAVAAGDRKALARAITLVESTRPDHREAAESLLGLLAHRTGGSIRVGLSGPPGVGKSTLIETLGNHVIGEGRRIAVLSVDPSSSLSGGSILGDKTRMERLARRSEAFIRPSPSGGTLGGVARRTREALLLCEAAGYDLLVVETVGVGQSETAVAEMTDVFVLLLLPGGGDELQGVKRGIVELADLVLVNKADGAMRDLAARTAISARAALSLVRPRSAGWAVPVLLCSAAEGAGIGEAWSTILRFHAHLAGSGELGARRAGQARAWMWTEVAESLLAALRSHPSVRESAADLESIVTAGEIPPPSAARRLLDLFLEPRSGPPVEPGAIGRLAHVAVAVPDLERAGRLYGELLGAKTSAPEELPEHGVRAVFVELPNTKVELLEPLGETSPLLGFLERNPSGGIHHLCYEVADLKAAVARLKEGGARLLGGGEPKTGAHGRPVVFLHPKDFLGTLIELEEK